MTTETLPEVRPIETRERTASDVLLAAARYIEEHGWCQDTYVNANGKVCILGAINAVTTQNPVLHEFDGLGGEAEIIIERFVGDASVSSWNDANGRTEAEVLAALREAAA